MFKNDYKKLFEAKRLFLEKNKIEKLKDVSYALFIDENIVYEFIDGKVKVFEEDENV